jgi:hypothetical protein
MATNKAYTHSMVFKMISLLFVEFQIKKIFIVLYIYFFMSSLGFSGTYVNRDILIAVMTLFNLKGYDPSWNGCFIVV